MLSAMRRNAKSPFVKILLLAVAVSFVIGFGAFMYVGEYIGKDVKTEYFVLVNDTQIPFNYYLNELKSREKYYRQILGDNYDQFKDNLNLKQQTLDSLIDRTLLIQQAQQMGIKVSDDEVRQQIVKFPAFQREGRFNQEVYRTILRRNNLTPGDFEKDIRQSQLVDKMSDVLVGFIKVSSQEIKEEYEANANKADFHYLQLAVKDYEVKVKVTDEEAQEYFNQNKAEFLVPEKRRARVVTVSPSDFEGDINLSDEDIQSYYQANQEAQFTEQEQVRASHILRRLPPDAGEEVKAATRELADDLLKKAKDGADFAELAEKYSQDETNKDQGGDLGFFQQGRMQKEFDDLAFSLDKGEVGGVVTTTYGLHIIKVTDKKEKRIKPLEEVRDAVVAALQKQESAQMTTTAIQNLHGSLEPGQSLTDLAQQKGQEAVLTDLVDKTTAMPGLDGGWQVTSALFGLAEGEVSAPIKGFNSWHLVELADLEEEHEPEFAEVKEAAIKKAKDKKLALIAYQDAAKILAEIAGERTLDEVAAAHGLTVKTTGLSSQSGDRIQSVGSDATAKKELFELTTTESLAKRPYQIGDKIYLFELSSRQYPSEEGLAEVEDDLRDQIQKRKGNERMKLWRESARQNAKILINETYRSRM